MHASLDGTYEVRTSAAAAAAAMAVVNRAGRSLSIISLGTTAIVWREHTYAPVNVGRIVAGRPEHNGFSRGTKKLYRSSPLPPPPPHHRAGRPRVSNATSTFRLVRWRGDRMKTKFLRGSPSTTRMERGDFVFGKKMFFLFRILMSYNRFDLVHITPPFKLSSPETDLYCPRNLFFLNFL